jgi:hypothetical protein
MTDKVNNDKANENTELSDERLEQASGGGGAGNDVLLGHRGNDVVLSTSGDADDRPTEEVAFYYNKIAFKHAKTVDGKE